MEWTVPGTVREQQKHELLQAQTWVMSYFHSTFFAVPKHGRMKKPQEFEFCLIIHTKEFWCFLYGCTSGAAPLSTRNVLVHFIEVLVYDWTEVQGSNAYILNESSSSTHLTLKGFSPLVIMGSDSLVFLPSMLILQDKLFLNTLYQPDAIWLNRKFKFST